ncbi:TPA: hypothetical protein ACVOZF_003388 [Vibrio diabolicus]|uniref:hypothetical protein n=1 Tax=Vibrio parahaemolyticus TaxID=670 RepID=UPI0004D81843|nr:hypothetical protein [Vibrio parahaemolyticus]
MKNYHADINSCPSAIPHHPCVFEKSRTAFLIEPSEAMRAIKDKPYYVDKWDFSTTHTVAINKTLTLSFSATLPEYKKAIQDTLYHLYHFFKQRDKVAPSISSMKKWRYGIQQIGTYLQGTKWHELDNRDKYKLFKQRFKQGNVGKDTAIIIISVINHLRVSGLINKVIEGNEFQKLAKKDTRQQAIAIPISFYKHLVADALKTIETYHKYRYQIDEVMEQAYQLYEQIENGEWVGKRKDRALSMHPSAIHNRKKRALESINHAIPNFTVRMDGAELNRIQTACLIVVLAFSGVRIGEACSFNKDSFHIKHVEGNEVAVLQGETSKGNDGKPQKATWQSHLIVKDALELAEDMMQSTRLRFAARVQKKATQGVHSSESIENMKRQLTSAFILSQLNKQSSDNFIMNSPSVLIFNYFKRLEIKATQEDVDEFDLLNPSREGDMRLGGRLSKLSPHDFRRTFAVFFVRYGFGTASGIKFQYKHNNLNMSNYYANNSILAKMNDILLDKDLLDEFTDARIDLGVDLFDDVYNKSENLSGKQGEAIQQVKLEKLKNGIDIYLTREEIEKHVRNGDFHIIQLPTGGYCTNPTCNRVCGSQPFRAEVKECVHQVFTDAGAKVLAKQRLRLIDKFKGMNKGDNLKRAILTGLKQKIQISEITLKKHNINFTPFTKEIKKGAA